MSLHTWKFKTSKPKKEKLRLSCEIHFPAFESCFQMIVYHLHREAEREGKEEKKGAIPCMCVELDF